MKWLYDNYQWLFGGIGATLIAILVDIFRRNKDKSIKQTQKSGDNSTNIQIGNINEK